MALYEKAMKSRFSKFCNTLFEKNSYAFIDIHKKYCFHNNEVMFHSQYYRDRIHENEACIWINQLRNIDVEHASAASDFYVTHPIPQSQTQTKNLKIK